MTIEIANYKDGITRPNQTTKNNTESLLSKMLGNLTDNRFTEDDNLETMYYILLKNKLDLNVLNHFCEKFNKEVPQTRRRDTSNCSTKTLYDWLRDDNNSAFEEFKYTYFDLYDNIDIISDDALSEFYHYPFDDGKYVFSSRTALWYYYDENIILKESTTTHPFRLKNGICKNLDNYLRQLRFRVKLPDKNSEKYQLQAAKLMDETNKTEKTNQTRRMCCV